MTLVDGRKGTLTEPDSRQPRRVRSRSGQVPLKDIGRVDAGDESRQVGPRLRPSDSAAGAQVVEHVRQEIEAGRLGPGQRLPPERELAQRMGVSRPSLRTGLRTLQAMGIVTARRGAGTFIVEGPPKLGKAPLQFLAALHRFTLEQMYEARRVLEVGAAALAAERATGEQLAAMADEVTGMFATLDEPQAFLRHDLGFHRAAAAGCGNPILATIIGTLTEIIRETGRLYMESLGLREAAETHRRIYAAIRARNPERARHEMGEHLEHARWEQVKKEMGGARPDRPAGDGRRVCIAGEETS